MVYHIWETARYTIFFIIISYSGLRSTGSHAAIVLCGTSFISSINSSLKVIYNYKHNYIELTKLFFSIPSARYYPELCPSHFYLWKSILFYDHLKNNFTSLFISYRKWMESEIAFCFQRGETTCLVTMNRRIKIIINVLLIALLVDSMSVLTGSKLSFIVLSLRWSSLKMTHWSPFSDYH